MGGAAFGYDDIETAVVEVDGIAIKVATPRMLYDMKKNTVRPQDHADAAWLAKRYRLEEKA